MFGSIQLEQFQGLTPLSQEAASAFSVTNSLTGASYKPLLYLGKKVAKGTIYYFIAEQTLTTNPPIRHVVGLAIHALNGKYELEGIEPIL